MTVPISPCWGRRALCPSKSWEPRDLGEGLPSEDWWLPKNNNGPDSFPAPPLIFHKEQFSWERLCVRQGLMLQKPVIILGSPPPTASAPVSVQGTSWPSLASCFWREWGEGDRGHFIKNPNSHYLPLLPKCKTKTKILNSPSHPYPNRSCQRKQTNINWLESLHSNQNYWKHSNRERSDKRWLILFYNLLLLTPTGSR